MRNVNVNLPQNSQLRETAVSGSVLLFDYRYKNEHSEKRNSLPNKLPLKFQKLIFLILIRRKIRFKTCEIISSNYYLPRERIRAGAGLRRNQRAKNTFINNCQKFEA